MIQTARPCESVRRCSCRRLPNLVITHGTEQQHIECARCRISTSKHHSFWLAAADWDSGRTQQITDTQQVDNSPEHVLLRLRLTLAHHRAGIAAAVKHAA